MRTIRTDEQAGFNLSLKRATVATLPSLASRGLSRGSCNLRVTVTPLAVISMEVVAQHLRLHTLLLASGADADLFGRSAFNRFYYSAFLTAKQLLSPTFPAIPQNHAGIPDFLRGTVRTHLSRVKKAAMRAGDLHTANDCSAAQRAAADLADLLAMGYTTRVVADYYPLEPVEFSSASGFKLNQIPVSEAQTWPHRSRAYSQLIINVMRNAGL